MARLQWRVVPQLGPRADEGPGDAAGLAAASESIAKPNKPSSEDPSGSAAPAPQAPSPPPQPVDPYARWAIASRWRGFVDPVAWTGTLPSEVRLIARLPEGNGKAGVQKSRAYQGSPQGHGGSPLRCFVGKVPGQQLEENPQSPGRGGLQWELAVALQDATAAEGRPDGLFRPDADQRRFRTPAVFTFDPRADRESQKSGSGSTTPSRDRRASASPGTLAVIDFGCPFLHRDFWDDQGTRISAIWDQGASPFREDLWTRPSGFDHGRELQRAMLDRMVNELRQGTTLGPADESEAYRSVEHLIDYDDPRRRIWKATHGGHVLGTLGGRHDPVTGQRADDAAGKADLVFVELPAWTAADSSGGSLSAAVLDAVRYILARADKDRPVVINLSYGSFAGPHDGSSLLEQALDELIAGQGGRLAIVLGAGNSRLADCHVRRQVRPGLNTLLKVEAMPGDPTDTFVELWYRPDAGVAMEARVRTPGGLWSAWLGLEGETMSTLAEPREHGTARSPGDGPDPVVAALIHRPARPAPAAEPSLPQAPGSKALLLLAVAATEARLGEGQPTAPAGTWEIELRKQKGDALVVDGWVERDDPPPGATATQAHFHNVDRLDAEETLSSIASGRLTVVASGLRLHDGSRPAYASTGTRASTIPLVRAACEESEWQPDLRSIAVRSGESHRMNGTSVAAPVLARRLFNLMVVEQQGTTAGTAVGEVEALMASRVRKVVDAQPGVLALDSPGPGGGASWNAEPPSTSKPKDERVMRA